MRIDAFMAKVSRYIDSDYIELLNSVQRHTQCSKNDCLRKEKQGKKELKCRFNVPFENCPNNKLEFEQVHSNDDHIKYRVKIVITKNDPRQKNHQQLQLQM